MSLCDFTANSTGERTIATFKLIERDLLSEGEIALFEWLYGLDEGGFPFDSSMNTIQAAQDLVPHIQNHDLLFLPSKVDIERALDTIEFNTDVAIHHRSAEQRQKCFQSFGEGPWEYFLCPEACDLCVPLYQVAGECTIPLIFDLIDFTALPRVMSTVHPLIAIFFAQQHLPCASECPYDEIIIPLYRFSSAWPFWTSSDMNPFFGLGRKRKRSNQQLVSDSGLLISSAASTSEASDDQDHQHLDPVHVVAWASSVSIGDLEEYADLYDQLLTENANHWRSRGCGGCPRDAEIFSTDSGLPGGAANFLTNPMTKSFVSWGPCSSNIPVIGHYLSLRYLSCFPRGSMVPYSL